MNIHDATETAYKNGYKQGVKDAAKWISVKDRLPEIDQHCLCYNKRNGHCCYQLGTYLGSRLSEDCAAFKSMSHYGCIGATHWMPLPEPPKGE